MFFDKALVQEKMLGWEGILHAYSLPDWNTFPALPLYMDQVIYLLNQYLSLLPAREDEEKLVTPAMINNYVKLKIIPPPVKKRYGRAHLAYLMMVCVLKQTLNTSQIRKLLPLSLENDGIESTYAAFVSTFAETKEEYLHQVRKASEPVFAQADIPITPLIFRVATEANLSKLLAEELVALRTENADGPEEA